MCYITLYTSLTLIISTMLFMTMHFFIYVLNKLVYHLLLVVHNMPFNTTICFV